MAQGGEVLFMGLWLTMTSERFFFLVPAPQKRRGGGGAEGVIESEGTKTNVFDLSKNTELTLSMTVECHPVSHPAV